MVSASVFTKWTFLHNGEERDNSNYILKSKNLSLIMFFAENFCNFCNKLMLNCAKKIFWLNSNSCKISAKNYYHTLGNTL